MSPLENGSKLDKGNTLSIIDKAIKGLVSYFRNLLPPRDIETDQERLDNQNSRN